MDHVWTEIWSFPQWYGHVPQISDAKLGSLFNQVRQVLYGAHFGKCLMTSANIRGCQTPPTPYVSQMSAEAGRPPTPLLCRVFL